VVGNLPSAAAGEYVEATGEWVQDREHGQQFKAESLRCTPPQTREGIEKFLGSGLVKGIGPHFAKKIVEVFGERTLAVIDESPTFLKEVKGIGARRIERIRASWQEQKAVRAIIVFLQSHGDACAFERDVLWDQRDRVGIRWIVSEADVGKPQLERERLRNLLFSGELHPHENGAEPLTGSCVLGQGFTQVILTDEARSKQTLTELVAHRLNS